MAKHKHDKPEPEPKPAPDPEPEHEPGEDGTDQGADPSRDDDD